MAKPRNTPLPTKISDLKPAPYNPRQISDAAIAGLQTSLDEFGDVSGITWNARTGHLVAGHQRVEALKKRFGDRINLENVRGTPCVVITGTTHAFPVRVVDWPESREKAANLAANNPHIAGDFTDGIAAIVGELRDSDLSALLEPLRLDDLLSDYEGLVEPEAGLTDPDDVPAPPDAATTKPGDLWLLGDHRLLCGDSSSPADLDRLLGGKPVHLVNTDPPYNVNVEPRSNNARAAGSKALPALAKKKAHLQGFDDARQGKPKPTDKKLRAKDRVLANDFMSPEDFDKVLLAWFGNIARALVPGGCFYVWGGFANWANYCQALAASGLYFAQGITWVKDHPVLGRKDFMNDCEHAWYGWKEGAGHKFYGPNNARNVWNVKKVNPQNMVHLTEKPVELATMAIHFSSRPGERILDLFGGSGSTLIGAEQTGRRAHLMELDALYCDVIVERFEKFTGKKAKRERGGKAA